VYVSLTDLEDGKLGIIVYKIDITERKKAEAALREERDKANMYLDIAGVILMVLDSEKKIKHINRKGCEVLGYNEGEIKGKNWIDNFIPVRFRRDVGDVYQQLISGEIEPVEYYENPILTKNGEEKIIAWHNTALRDDHGNIIGTLSSGEDITERRQVEEALLESEEKYRDLIDNTDELIQSVKPDGHFRYVNNSWRQALGYSEDEISDLTIFDIIHPDYLQHCQMVFERVMSGEDVGWIETALISKNSGKVIIEGNVTCKFENGKPMFTRGIFRDITKSKYMEEHMARLSSAISMSTECIVITDFNAKIIDINQKTLELYGADSKDELIGSHFLKIIGPAEREMVTLDVKEVIEKGYMECREYNMVSKLGCEFPMQMSTSLVRTADGKPMGMVRVGRKLSEINELNAGQRKTGHKGYR
jgi:PAS domain S-box-containing protein